MLVQVSWFRCVPSGVSVHVCQAVHVRQFTCVSSGVCVCVRVRVCVCVWVRVCVSSGVCWCVCEGWSVFVEVEWRQSGVVLEWGGVKMWWCPIAVASEWDSQPKTSAVTLLLFISSDTTLWNSWYVPCNFFALDSLGTDQIHDREIRTSSTVLLMEASACEASTQFDSSTRSTIALAFGHECFGSCLVLYSCLFLPWTFLVCTLRIIPTTTTLDIMHCSRLCNRSSRVSLWSKGFVQLNTCQIESFFFIFIREASFELIVFSFLWTSFVPRGLSPCISRLVRVPSTFCCCFIQMHLRLPLICFSFGRTRASFGHRLTCDLHRIPEALDLATVVWELQQSSIDPACSQHFPARFSCWTLRVLTAAAQVSHGSRQGRNLW